MSYFDYRASLELASDDHPFYALIMAAMRQADTLNAARLRNAFPDVYDEFYLRYNTPGGFLDDDG